MYYIILLTLIFALLFFCFKIYLKQKESNFNKIVEYKDNIYHLSEYRELSDKNYEEFIEIDDKIDMTSYELVWSEEEQSYVKTPKNKITKLFILLKDEED